MISIDQHVFVDVPETFVKVPEYLLPPNRCSAEMYVGVVPLEGGGQLLFGLMGKNDTYWTMPSNLLETLAKNPVVPGLLRQPERSLREPRTKDELDKAIEYVFSKIVSFSQEKTL